MRADFVTFLFLAQVGIALSQYTSPVFHRTFSTGCAESDIRSEADCPLVKNKSQWSRERKTPQSDTRFNAVTDEVNKASKKCYSKLSVKTQKCNANPACVMTTYKYSLPKAPTGVDPTKCTNDWSIKSECKVDGPGGTNTKAVYFHCFKRGVRPFCGIKFESCQPEKCYTWTKYQRQCYAECSTTSVTGVALQFVRRCKECDGHIVDGELCKGGKAASTQLRRCVPRSRARANAPDCLVETTAAVITTTTTTTPTTPTPTTAVKRTTPTTRVVTTTTIHETTTEKPTPSTSKSTTTQELDTTNTPISTTTRKRTTTPKPTKPITTQEVTTSLPTTTIQETTAIAKQSTSESFTIISAAPTTTRKRRRKTTKTPKTTRTSKSQESRNVQPRILLPPQAEITTRPPHSELEKTTADLSAGYNDQGDKLDLITIAGGAGAGIVFIFLIIIIIVLLVKRRDSKPSPDASFASSSLRSKTTKSAIVDSSSFRIETWIRERPPLRHGSTTSTDSGVSDAEYWRVGEPSKENADRYSPVKPNESNDPKVPGAGKTPSAEGGGDEHIYDEVAFGDVEDMRTMVSRHFSPRKNRHTSATSSRSEPPTSSADWPNSDSAVYAVVRKVRKKEQQGARKKRSPESRSSDFRRTIASEHSASVTRLNGRQLKEGVLQIEFDEKEGIRCRLSNSNVYMNLEETDPPPVK